jgi:hypothetical protein
MFNFISEKEHLSSLQNREANCKDWFLGLFMGLVQWFSNLTQIDNLAIVFGLKL